MIEHEKIRHMRVYEEAGRASAIQQRSHQRGRFASLFNSPSHLCWLEVFKNKRSGSVTGGMLKCAGFSRKDIKVSSFRDLSTKPSRWQTAKGRLCSLK